MKKIRNIVPIPAGGVVVDPGTIWEEDPLGLFVTEGYASVNYGQASDRRLFEPEEERFINLGNEYRAIDDLNAQATAPIEWTADAVDKAWLEIGNCFRTDTNLNPAGVHIDDALKVFKLALRVPRLWHTLKDCLGTEGRENEQVDAVYASMLEIEAASQPGGCA